VPDMLILASGSPIRRALLERAGIAVTVETMPVDEAEIREGFAAEGAPVEDCAIALAELKAMRVSSRRPGSLVIGADQILECEGIWFEKPAGRAEARAQLQRLRGRSHRLVSGCTVLRDGQRIWHIVDEATLRMRDLSEGFIEDYLDRAGDAVMGSVGAYQLEGLGAQLFDRVEGDFFTVLGLPLLPLLGFLRGRGVIGR